MRKEFIFDIKAVSVNKLYTVVPQRHCVVLSKEGRQYKDYLIKKIGLVDYEFTDNIKIEIEFHYKSKGYDVDNGIKVTLDAFTEANIWSDDDLVQEVNAKVFRYSTEDMVKVSITGNIACTDSKSSLIIFGKLTDIDEYLNSRISLGYKVIKRNNIYYENGVCYQCISKRQLKSFNTDEYGEILYM